jgi:hypothetical protein
MDLKRVDVKIDSVFAETGEEPGRSDVEEIA